MTSDEIMLLAGPAPGDDGPAPLEPLAGPLLDPSRFPDPMPRAAADRVRAVDPAAAPLPDHRELTPGATKATARILDPLAGPLVDRTRFPEPMPGAAPARDPGLADRGPLAAEGHGGAALQDEGRRAGARAAKIRGAPRASTLAPLSVPVVTPSRPAAAPKTLASYWAFGG